MMNIIPYKLQEMNIFYLKLFVSINILFPVFILLVSSVGFFYGQTIHSIHIIIAFFGAVWLTYYLYKPMLCQLLAITLAVFCMLTLGQWLARHVIDHWYDSRVYHLPAIIALKYGWNPFTNIDVCSWSSKFCLPNYVLSNFYPKAVWILAASFYSLTGNFETGKTYNFICCVVSLVACLNFFLKGRYLSLAKSFLFSTCLAFNPITIKQLGSFYVDGINASFMLMFFVFCLDYVLHKSFRSLVLAGCIFIFLINIKFTGLVYGVIIALGILLIGWYNDKKIGRQFISMLLISGFLGIAVAGYNPYITNTLEHHNPFYPAIKLSGGQGVLEGMAEPGFLIKSRFKKTIISIFSRSDVNNSLVPRIFSPLSGFHVTPYVDDRFSGFGEPFSIAFVLGAIVFTFVRNRLVIALVVISLVSIFSTAAGWWARLTPQIWWIPILAALGILTMPRRSLPLRACSYAVITILLLTSMATLAISSITNYQYSRHYKVLLEQLKKSQVFVSPMTIEPNNKTFTFTLAQRLSDEGITILSIPPPTCNKLFEELSEARICLFLPSP